MKNKKHRAKQNTLRDLCAIALSGLLALQVCAAELNPIPEEDWLELTQSYDLSRDDIVYLDFWASWCVPCRKSFPWLNAMHARYSEKGLTIIGVNLDRKLSDANTFLEKVPAQFPIFYDPNGKFAQLLQLPGMPSSYIFDADGNLLTSHKGFKSKRIPEYEASILNALKLNTLEESENRTHEN